MTEPIFTKVADDVFQTLQSIKTTAGYNTDLIAEIETLHETEIRDRLAIMVVGEATLDEQDSPTGFDDYDMQFAVIVFMRHAESDSKPAYRRAWIAAGDIIKALQVDVTRENYSCNTTPESISPIEDSDSGAYVLRVSFVCRVRSRIAQPFERYKET